MTDDLAGLAAPAKKPHWYFIHVWYCVLCALTLTERERRYDERPVRWEDRHELTEDACSGHFL